MSLAHFSHKTLKAMLTANGWNFTYSPEERMLLHIVRRILRWEINIVLKASNPLVKTLILCYLRAINLPTSVCLCCSISRFSFRGRNSILLGVRNSGDNGDSVLLIYVHSKVVVKLLYTLPCRSHGCDNAQMPVSLPR